MRFGILLLAILAVILLLKWQFPYAVQSSDQMVRVFYLALMILLIGSGSGMLGRMKTTQAVRDALLWIGIILLLVLGYSFRGDIRHSRVFTELVPSRITQSADGGYSIGLGEDGHFHLEAEVNGVLLRFMIDTGASDIVLSPRDAQDVGFDLETLNYTRSFQTANGRVSGAPVRLKVMTVGPMTLRDVPASVNGADMDTSLLGMAFLKQFRRYDVNDDKLTLYP